MLRKRLHRSHKRDPAELNITAFMNLMVILVPFLLITAVFSRVAVLSMDLPTAQDEAPEPVENDDKLAITIRPDFLVVANTKGGEIDRIARTGEGPADYDYEALSALLLKIKLREPERTSIHLLSEPETPYDAIIQVMDRARVVKQEDELRTLFPDIGLGDAAPADK